MTRRAGAAKQRGDVLGERYTIEEELGRGGMGTVYRARDTVLDRDVAVKVLHTQSSAEEGEERFQREARIIARLDHPGIVAVYDFQGTKEGFFIVMPLIKGETLRSKLEEGPLASEELSELGQQVAEALDYSHLQGVVHRDIKPENIMVLGGKGAPLRAKVMDFGIALGAADSRVTQEGKVMGTLAYLSPEQLTGEGLDLRSDIYSLGVVLYEAIVGRPPFEGDFRVMVNKILNVPPDARALEERADPAIASLVLRAIAKKPADRPATMGEMALTLRAVRPRPSARILPNAFSKKLAGRSAELTEIQSRLDRALAGECQLVLFEGDPGIGKTTLLTEAGRLGALKGARVLGGRCVERSDALFPYQAFIEAIEEGVRGLQGDVAPPLLDALRRLALVFPSIGDGLPQQPDKEPLEKPSAKNEIFELIARALTHFAAPRGLVLRIEDLHQADISAEALHYLFRRLRPTRTLIVCAFRPLDSPDQHPLAIPLRALRGDPRAVVTTLRPLDRESIAKILAESTKVTLDQGITETIYELSEGNPLLALELLRTIDAGRLKTGHSTVEIRTIVSALPEKAQDVIAYRFDRLSAPEKTLLSVASILGSTFDLGDVEGLTDESSDLEPVADALVEKEFFDEGAGGSGRQLTFASALVYERTYGALPVRRRKTLHRRALAWLERRPGRNPAILYLHALRGDETAKAVDYALQASGAALEAAGAEEALKFARGAAQLVETHGETRPGVGGESALLEASALARLARSTGAIEAAERSDAAFESAGLSERRVAALLLGAETAWREGRVDAASRFARQGLELSRAKADTPSVHRLLRIVDSIAEVRGGSEEAKRLRLEFGVATGQNPTAKTLEHSSEANALVEAERQLVAENLDRVRSEADASPVAEAQQLLALAVLEVGLGRLEEALACCCRGIDLAQDQDAALAIRLGARASSILCLLGRLGEAKEMLARTRAFLTGVPENRSLEALVLDSEARVAWRDGRVRDAIDFLVQSLADDGAEAVDLADRPSKLTLLVAAHLRAGSTPRARVMSRQLTELAENDLERDLQPWVHFAAAALRLCEGCPGDAVKFAKLGLAAIEGGLSTSLRGDLELILTRGLLELSDLTAAEASVLRAIREAEKTGRVPLMIEAQVSLAAIHSERGRYLVADVALGIAQGLATQGGLTAAAPSMVVCQALLWLDTGRAADARTLLDQERVRATEGGDWDLVIRLAEIDLRFVLSAGDFQAAERIEKEIRVAAERLGSPPRAARAGVWMKTALRRKTGDLQVAGLSDDLDLALRGPDTPTALQAHKALVESGFVAGDLALATQHAHAALQLSETLETHGGLARAIAYLLAANVAWREGAGTAFEAHLDAARKALPVTRSPADVAFVLCQIAETHRRVDEDRAPPVVEEAIALARAAQAPRAQFLAATLRADLENHRGEIIEALETLSEVITAQSAGEPFETRGLVSLKAAQMHFAAGHLAKAFEIVKDCNNWPYRIAQEGSLWKARILKEQGDIQGSLSLLTSLERSFEDEALARLRCAQAEVYLAVGASRKAASLLESIDNVQPKNRRVRALVEMGVLAAEGGHPKSLTHAEEILAQCHVWPVGDQLALRCAHAGLIANAYPQQAEKAARAIAERASGAAMALHAADALFLLARLTRDMSVLEEGYQFALGTGSQPRIALYARLMATLHSKAGHEAEARRAWRVAASVRSKVLALVPDDLKASAELHWDDSVAPLVAE